MAAALQPIDVSQVTLAEAGAFIARRLQGVLLESGFAHDIVDAVLAARAKNPFAAARSCTALTEAVSHDAWMNAFTAYARCARITRNLDEQLALNPDAYEDPVEHTLHEVYERAAARMAESEEPAGVLGDILAELQPPIDAYFETVLVNADAEALRNARLALVQRIASLPDSVADLSKLQGF